MSTTPGMTKSRWFPHSEHPAACRSRSVCCVRSGAPRFDSGGLGSARLGSLGSARLVSSMTHGSRVAVGAARYWGSVTTALLHYRVVTGPGWRWLVWMIRGPSPRAPGWGVGGGVAPADKQMQQCSGTRYRGGVFVIGDPALEPKITNHTGQVCSRGNIYENKQTINNKHNDMLPRCVPCSASKPQCRGTF